MGQPRQSVSRQGRLLRGIASLLYLASACVPLVLSSQGTTHSNGDLIALSRLGGRSVRRSQRNCGKDDESSSGRSHPAAFVCAFC